jgi:hypothetical protein
LSAAAGDRRALESPRRRVVLLGASNLTKGIGTVVDTATRLWGGPLEVLSTLGHGRSYGRESRVVAVRLPGITQCGLWRDLAAAPKLPTAGLVTDIGNDLLYEEPVERIAAWVAECLDRLAALEATTVLTLLPVDNLRTLGPARFHLVRKIFFPSSRITLEEVSERAWALNDELRTLAAERGVTVVEHRPIWYGLDPIHIRFAHRGRAWRDILAGWTSEGAALAPSGAALAQTLFLRTRTPQQRHVLGFAQRGRSPSASFRNGTRVTFY